ncbi:DMT family protein [Microbacterium sp. GXF7504]
MDELGSLPLAGIALAVGSAAALAVGNLLQARGVRIMEHRTADGHGSKVGHLLRNRAWLLGAVLLGVAILLQLGSLTFAPLIVVQPIGVAALVFTAIATALSTHRRPSAQVVRAIALCVLGVAAFVTVAALVSTQRAITDGQLAAVLLVLVGVLVATGVIVWAGRTHQAQPVLWVLLGGVFSAFVATLGKTVILRVQTLLQAGSFAWNLDDLLTLGCLVGIAVAGGLSIWFVQLAHAHNRPESVVAGLTVIDPAVAVVLGITILGEAAGAPLWAIPAFIVAGAVAVSGVFALSRAQQEAPAGASAMGHTR